MPENSASRCIQATSASAVLSFLHHARSFGAERICGEGAMSMPSTGIQQEERRQTGLSAVSSRLLYAEISDEPLRKDIVLGAGVESDLPYQIVI
jgi:hypothetical protein